MASSSKGKLPDKAKVQQFMATFKPITHEDIASRKVIVVGEQAEVMGSSAAFSSSWWDDCEAADKSKKYLFEVFEYEEKRSFIVGSGQRTTTTVKSLYPCFKPSVAEIFEEYQKTRDDICDNDVLEANEDDSE